MIKNISSTIFIWSLSNTASTVTISPAVRLPSHTINIDFKKGISKNVDTALPVHTPVIGKGTATKIYTPSIFFFSSLRINSGESFPSSLAPTTLSALLLNPLSTAFAREAKALYFFIQLSTGCKIKSKIGETIAEPVHASAKASKGCIPIVIAAGIAPLSSTIGIIAISIVVI